MPRRLYAHLHRPGRNWGRSGLSHQGDRRPTYMSQDHYNALPEGHKLHEYTIKSVLGHGGFGITYLAWDENLNKDVAIKEYLPTEFAVRSGDATVGPRSSSDDEDYNWGLDRFVTEAQTLALFRHPSIVPVYRFFKAHGTAYMVMEYQEGESFSVLMRKHRGDLTEADLMGLVQPMLDGLAEVHRAGFLHRDVKPGNIFIRRDGSPVLLDFGAARSAVGRKSQNLTSIVTPGYAPLEQYFADGNQGPWTDIYSLAAILYQCVAGKLPPEAPARVKKDPITPISEIGAGKFSDHFLAAIDRALMVEEEERPQTTTEWRDMLLGRAASGAGMATAAEAEEADQTMVAGGFGAGATMLAGGAAGAQSAQAASAQAASAQAGSALAGSATPAAGATPTAGPRATGPAGAAVAAGPAPGGFATQAQARAAGRAPGAESLSVGDPVTHTRPSRGGAALKYAIVGFAAVFLIAFSAGAAYFVLSDDDGLGIFSGKESEEAKRKAADDKRRAEEAARKRAEDAALKAAEEKRRKEEAAGKAEDERKAREREAAKRTEEGRKRLEAEARRKRLAEEAARRTAEEKKRKEVEARRRAGDETRRQAEARRKQEAEDARRRTEEARLREEEARRRADEEKRRREEEKRKQLASRTDGVSCPMSLSGLNGRYKNAIDCYYVRKIFQSALSSGVRGTTSSWRNSRTGNRGSLTVIATVRMANDTFCRRFRQTLVSQGRSYSATGVACFIGQRWQIRN